MQETLQPWIIRYWLRAKTGRHLLPLCSLHHKCSFTASFTNRTNQQTVTFFTVNYCSRPLKNKETFFTGLKDHLHTLLLVDFDGSKRRRTRMS